MSTRIDQIENERTDENVGVDDFSQSVMGSLIVFDDEEPRVVLRSPVDCSSVARAPQPKNTTDA